MRLLSTRLSSIRGSFLPADLYLRALQTPAFDLRFFNGTIVDAISGITPTFTRPSSTKNVWNGTQFVSVAADVPAFQVDPVTGRLGYLHEPSATNGIRNNSIVGAVAGTPGTLPTNWAIGGATGLTREIVGTGTEAGINYIDLRFSGTAGSASTNIFPEVAVHVVAASGQTWTASAFARIIANPVGTATGALAIQGRTAANVFVESPGTAAFNSFVGIANRIAVTYTFANALTERATHVLTVAYTNGAAVDFTVRIGWSQLETGTVATSPIIASGSAVTRAADTMTVSGANFSSWYNQLGGTLYWEGSMYNLSAVNTGCYALEIAASPGVNFYRSFRQSTTQLLGSLTTASVAQANLDSTGFTWTTSDARRTATRIQADSMQHAFQGILSPLDTSATLPAFDLFRVGAFNAASNIASSLIYRLAYFPPGPAQSRIQQMTI